VDTGEAIVLTGESWACVYVRQSARFGRDQRQSRAFAGSRWRVTRQRKGVASGATNDCHVPCDQPAERGRSSTKTAFLPAP
jgi:hypothetical protein